MQAAADYAQAQRTLLVRASVMHGEEAILPAQNSNLIASNSDDPEAPILEIGDGANVDSQLTFSAAAAGFSSSSAFQP